MIDFNEKTVGLYSALYFLKGDSMADLKICIKYYITTIYKHGNCLLTFSWIMT